MRGDSIWIWLRRGTQGVAAAVPATREGGNGSGSSRVCGVRVLKVTAIRSENASCLKVRYE